MSGGSFNYLCYKVDSEDIPEDEVKRMAEWLREKNAIEAAVATERVLFHLRQARAVAQELEGIWHAAEWWRSGDYGEDQFKEAVEEWESKKEQVE